MKKIKFNNLRMIASYCDDTYLLKISIASGFADFGVSIELNKNDFDVIEKDEERASLLHAAFHHPFQLQKSALSKEKQRQYLDVILHAEKPEVESFLTKLDHGGANGAISNMIRITCNRDQSELLKGHWFI